MDIAGNNDTTEQEEPPMRRMMLLAALVFGAMLSPVSAQSGSQTDAAVASKIQQLIADYVQSYNRHDAASVAALYTQDAVLVGATGVMVAGRDGIEKFLATAFKTTGGPILAAKATQIHALGENAWGIGEYTTKISGQRGPTEIKGHWAAVYLHESGDWRIRMLSAGTNMLSAAPAARGPSNR